MQHFEIISIQIHFLIKNLLSYFELSSKYKLKWILIRSKKVQLI